MAKINRRNFIYSTALLAAVPGIVNSFGSEAKISYGENTKKILLGVITSADNPDADLRVVSDLGFPTCQLSISKYTPKLAVRLKAALEKYNLQATSLICMGPGT